MALAVTASAPSVLAAPPNIRHVAADAPAGGDGQTWATAYTDLKAAITAATASGGAITELWVKAGTYYPAPAGSAIKTFTFSVADGLAVYGGFAGVESARDGRDPAVNITTLNGDRGDPTRRVYHVVTMSGVGPVLDGVTVTGGHAEGELAPQNCGGGVHVTATGAVISNCIITGNLVQGTADDVSFLAVGYGGGIYAGPGSELTVRDSLITNNAGAWYPQRPWQGYGAGVAGRSCTLNLVRCTISNNRATDAGFERCSTGSPSSCPGSNGGGVYLSSSTAQLENCVIKANRAGSGGEPPGCVTSHPRPARGGHGGGMYIFQSTVALVNCLLTDNRAGDGGFASVARPSQGGDGGSGGGIASRESILRVVNSTMAANRVGAGGFGFDPGEPGKGAGIYTFSYSSAMTVENSVLWDDGAGLYLGSAAYSAIKGGTLFCTTCFTADPLFVSAATGDYRLADGSPCIDGGNSHADTDPTAMGIQPPPAVDLDGRPRFVDDPTVADHGAGPAPIVDMGAYEHRNPPCAADFTGDGIVDFSDYLEFLNLFDAGDLRADFTGDGEVDFGDYLEFLNHYDAGC